MSWALSGRTTFAFAIAVGVLVGAGAAVLGIELAVGDHAHPAVAAAAASPDPARIIDVSRMGLALAGSDIETVLALDPRDPVVAIDGVPTARGIAAVREAWAAASPGLYLDLETASGRRSLVLVHP